MSDLQAELDRLIADCDKWATLHDETPSDGYWREFQKCSADFARFILDHRAEITVAVKGQGLEWVPDHFSSQVGDFLVTLECAWFSATEQRWLWRCNSRSRLATGNEPTLDEAKSAAERWLAEHTEGGGDA